MEIIETHNNGFLISTDSEKLDLSVIHNFLANESGWSKGIPLKTVQTSIENSLNFGLYLNNNQIGYARVISDYSTIAYLGDVFVLEGYRGRGLSKWLINEVMEHPSLQGLRRWILLTDTADWLYQKYGFKELPRSEIYMEKHNPHVYKNEE